MKCLRQKFNGLESCVYHLLQLFSIYFVYIIELILILKCIYLSCMLPPDYRAYLDCLEEVPQTFFFWKFLHQIKSFFVKIQF